MDINIIITKVNELQTLANQYYVVENQKDALDGQSDGILTVNDQELEVDGTDFDDLLTSLISDLGTELTTIKAAMEVLNDEITAEIDA